MANHNSTLVSFDFQLIDFEGKPILGPDSKPLNAGRYLGNELGTLTRGDTVKIGDWAENIYKGVPIALDESDFNLLHKLIDESQTIYIVVKRQLHKHMKAAQMSKK